MLSSGRSSRTTGAQRRGRSHAIAGLSSTSRSTRSGIVSAISMPIRPPMLLPTTCARSMPAASSTAAITDAKYGASNGARSGLTESPKPGRSTAITR